LEKKPTRGLKIFLKSNQGKAEATVSQNLYF